MKLDWLVRCFSMTAVAVLLTAAPASAADLHVLISAGFYRAYSELVPAFERASGHHLVTTRGPSMGDSQEAIPARLTRGACAAWFPCIAGGGAGDRQGGAAADRQAVALRNYSGAEIGQHRKIIGG